MRFLKAGLLIVALLLTLGAPSCSRETVTTSIGEVAIATGLELYNQPSNELAKVAASSETIYATAEVLNSSSNARVRVRWHRLPNTLLSTQDFLGQRSNSNKFDFQSGAKSSYLASSIAKTDISWPLGEYRVEFFVNNQIAKSINFDIVSDDEATEEEIAAIVRKVTTGDTLDSQFKIASSKNSFTRDTNNIYIQTNLQNAPANTAVDVRVRYVKEDRTFATFSYNISGDDEIVVDLKRDPIANIWSDNLWPEGAFEVTIIINNIEAASHTFLVEAG